jgi:hypothetical protein
VGKWLSYVKKAGAGGVSAAGAYLAAKAGDGVSGQELAEAAGAFVVGAILVFLTPKNGPKPS